MPTMYIRDFPDNLHRRFKSLCVLNGEHMRERIIELVREYVEKEEKKRKK